MRFTGASDAVYEGEIGSGGFLAVFYQAADQQFRVGRVVDMPTAVYKYWGEYETYIA